MSTSEQNRPRSYLDYNASAPLAAGVREAVAAGLALPGNPNSPHAEGREARRMLEGSRVAIAQALGAEPLDLIFCSGGTEANHLGLMGLATAPGPGSRVLLAPTLHPSLEAAGRALQARSLRVDAMTVDGSGRIELAWLKKELAAGDVRLLAFSLANHETGALERVSEIVELASAAGARVFCDAVQAWGRVPLQVAELAVQGMALSAHKIGGPKGVGALWLAPGPDVGPLVGGGKQEGGRRPGTQACGLIAGFAAAARGLQVRLGDADRQAALRARVEAELEAMGAELNSGEAGLCNTISARFAGVAGDVLVSSLDLQGVAISTGAACSSGTTAASTNLLAMGLSEARALETIRISLGPGTLDQDVKVLLELLPGIVQRARRFS